MVLDSSIDFHFYAVVGSSVVPFNSSNMNNYTNAEIADMHFMYCRANGNCLEARRLYAEVNPRRVIRHHTIFVRERTF